jgi:predicted transcriptional regulator
VSDALRAAKSAEAARSHAYNAEVKFNRLSQEFQQLKASFNVLVENQRQLQRQLASLQASLDAAMRPEETE